MEETKNESVEVNTESKATTVDQAKIDKLQAEYDALNKANSEKVYGLPIKNEMDRQLFIDFIDNDVEWKYMQAFGIPKIYEALTREEIKNGKIYMKGIEVEALSFYLMSAHGKGRKSAERFLKMKDIVDEAYKMREADNRQLNSILANLETLQAAQKQGIDIEAPVEKSE